MKVIFPHIISGFLVCVLQVSLGMAQIQPDSMKQDTSFSYILVDTFRIVSDFPSSIPGTRVEHIDPMMLAANQCKDFGELISRSSPVFVKSYGSGGLATPSFRGTGASHTQIVWNGVPVNSIMLGQSDLALFPVSMTDKVSIHYGNGNQESFSGGLGGVIESRNSMPYSETDYSEVGGSLNAGSFGFLQGNGMLRLQRKNLGSTTRSFFRTAKNDFPFLNTGKVGSPVEYQSNAGFTQWGAQQEVYFGVENMFKWVGAVQSSERDLPANMLAGDQMESQNDLSVRNVLDYLFFPGRLGGFRLRAGHIYDMLEYRNEIAGIESKSETNQFSIQGEWGNVLGSRELFSVSIRSGSFYNTAETDAYSGLKSRFRQSLSTRILFHSPRYKTSNKHTAFRAGLFIREELVDGNFSPVLPSAGVDILPWNSLPLSFHLNAARNYRIPTLNDLYWVPGGNSDLLPEEGWSQEASIMIKGKSLEKLSVSPEFKMSIYRSDIRNWILWYPGTSGFWQPENVLKVRTSGLEADLRLRYGKGKTKLEGRGICAFTRSVNMETVLPNDESLGKQLIYTPEHTFKSYLSVSRKNVYMQYGYRFIGSRFVVRDNSSSLPSYNLMDILVGYKFTLKGVDVETTGRIDNLFDVSYQAIQWRAMPGRAFYLGIELNFHKDRTDGKSL